MGEKSLLLREASSLKSELHEVGQKKNSNVIAKSAAHWTLNCILNVSVVPEVTKNRVDSTY